MEERLRKVEPTKVTVDGREFIADPREQRDFEAALAVFRKGEFARRSARSPSSCKRYPQSGYTPRPCSGWAMRSTPTATTAGRSPISGHAAQAPDHARAPEAVLSIANCQIELKDNAGARRKTLDDLVKAYPQSEAARQAANGWRGCAGPAVAQAARRPTALPRRRPIWSAASAAWSACTASPGAAAIRDAMWLVVGIGGVGSWAAEALARSGVGALTLIDLDHVAESNINRQIHALDGTVGQAKVEAMRERIGQIHPGCACIASRISSSPATGSISGRPGAPDPSTR